MCKRLEATEHLVYLWNCMWLCEHGGKQNKMRGCKNLGLLWYAPKQIRDVITVMSIAAPKSLMIDPVQQGSHSDPDEAKLVQLLGKYFLLLYASFNSELTNKCASELKKKKSHFSSSQTYPVYW